MQFSRAHVLGAGATDNGGFATYDALFSHCFADAALLEADIVIYDTTPLATGLLGHSVVTTTTADSPVVAGIVAADAAAGQPVLVQISGVGYVTVLAAVSAAGEAISTSATPGSATDSSDAAGAYSGELAASVAGVSLEARSATIAGQALCRITCG